MKHVHQNTPTQALPKHVAGIINAVIEESKRVKEGELHIEHFYQGMTRTRVTVKNIDGLLGVKPIAVSLSHTVYPEETLVAVYEDGRMGEPSATVTRHYQPKNYLGKNAVGVSNSSVYQTQVSRLDEANIHTDIFHFLKTGQVPA